HAYAVRLLERLTRLQEVRQLRPEADLLRQARALGIRKKLRRAIGHGLALDLAHLGQRRQLEVAVRRTFVALGVEIRKARATRRSRRERLQHGMLEVCRGALADADEAARIDAVPAAAAAIVFAGGAARVDDGAGTQIAEARAAWTGVGVDPRAPSDAANLLARGGKRQIVAELAQAHLASVNCGLALGRARTRRP